jgi:hypothetical protein
MVVGNFLSNGWIPYHCRSWIDGMCAIVVVSTIGWQDSSIVASFVTTIMNTIMMIIAIFVLIIMMTFDHNNILVLRFVVVLLTSMLAIEIMIAWRFYTCTGVLFYCHKRVGGVSYVQELQQK